MIFKRLLALLAIVAFVVAAPAARAQFVDQQTWGGTSGGSANAQTLQIGNMGSPVVGVPVRFSAGFTTTGPLTLNIDGFGALQVLRPSSIGNVALSGGEIFFGELVTVIYTPGGYYILASNIDMTRIGDIVEYRGSAVPRGTLVEDGSCVSQTTYAPLFSVIGTAYGSCSAGLFALPDSRGTMVAALDNQGLNGAANRITSAGSGCNATAIGLCGSQNVTLTLPQLPTGITSSNTGSIALSVASTISNILNGGTADNYTSVAGTGTFNSPSRSQITSTGNILAGNASVTSNNTSGQPHAIINPISLARRAIKY
jgi:microcystin-dependent protein